MSEKQLHFDQIEIRRMPGIDQRFILDKLQPGINVIVGPNGSGKTTTRKALSSVLWPNQSPARAHVVGHFELDGATWRVEVDAGRAECQREGVLHPLPDLPAIDLKERYHLGLPELLTEEDGAFAARIIRETAGGYDIERAAAAVGVRSQASAANIGEAQALKEARRKRQEVQRRQEALQQDEKKLAQLEQEKAAAERAAVQQEKLARVVVLIKAEATYREAQARLDALPAGMALLSRRDEEMLQELKRARQETVRDIEKLKQQYARAKEDQAASRLPAEGVPGTILSSLREQQQALARLEEKIAELEQEARAAGNGIKEATRQVGDSVQISDLQRLTRTDLEQVANWARQAEQVRVRHKFYAEHRAWLAEQFDLTVGEQEQWQQGRHVLAQWLEAAPRRQTPPSRLPHLLLLLAGGVIILAGIGLGLSLHPLFLVTSLLGMALGLYGLVQIVALGRAGTGEVQGAQEQFEALDLQPPAAWEGAEVANRLSELEQKLAAANQYQKTTHLLQQQQEQAEKLRGERQELVQRLGLAPALTEGLDEAVLYNLVHALNRWQEAKDAALTARSRWETARERHRQLLAAINETLAPYGDGAATDAATAAGQIEALAERQQQFRDAGVRVENAQDNLDRAEKQQAQVDENYRAFFTARELPEGDERAFQQRYERLDEYDARHKQMLQARLDRDQKKADLPEGEIAGESVEVLCGKSLDELKVLHQQAAAKAARRDELVQKISDISAEVKLAKEGAALEEALAHEERCVARLRQKREEDCVQVAANAIAAHLQAVTANHARPAVFHRGSEKFTRITNGRYELTMGNGDTPSFRAVDHVTGRGYELAELSSGTRVQLLLAIRLAFVERQESVRLPIFFDEALGNSDEQRAQAIIQAAITLAQEGRQLFYFTAQQDEVGKWQQVVARLDGNIPFQVIELDKVRQMAAAGERPLKAVPIEPQSIPAPKGMDYYAYGDLLGVPAVDPTRDGVGHLHIWHVLDDAEVVYHLLQRGIRHFGELQGLANANQLAPFGMDEQSYRRAAARARALKEAAAAWRVGRGRPVDREALVASGHVSDTFIDRVTSLARDLDGDAAALVAALRTRDDERAARFRDDNCDGLEEYLQAQGYIDTRDPLSPAEIQRQVKIALADELAAGVLAPEEIKALVQRVVG